MKIKKVISWSWKFIRFFSVFFAGIFCGSLFVPQKTSSQIKNWVFQFWQKADSEYAFGIDVSSYQGEIDWDTIDSKHPVEFSIIRCTMGDDRIDIRYKENIKKARKKGLLVGSYHYYDPDENSTLQAKNFCKNVDFRKGDLRPVLDIEKLSKVQPHKRLMEGLNNWRNIIYEELGVYPIIYSGLVFYEDYLAEDFPESDNLLWLAAYSKHRREEVLEIADMIQFSEEINVSGIQGNVDGNDIPRQNLKKLTF